MTCQRLSNYGSMLRIGTNPALRNRENFVLCFANIVLCKEHACVVTVTQLTENSFELIC